MNYWNNWNKTGKIKTIVLGILALPNLFVSNSASEESYVGLEMIIEPEMTIIMPLIFGAFAIPLIAKFNKAFFGLEIIKPTWNDNPITLKRSLSFFHFFAYFFLTAGISSLLGIGIKFHTINYMGLFEISYGIGILIGIKLTLNWIKTK